MPVSLVEIELKSPTLLVRRVGRMGFSSMEGWIPGSTLRGSIVTWSVRYGRLGEGAYAREMSEPTLVVHPAYPVDGATARPPTPFTFRCKLEDTLVDTLGREGVKELTRAESLGDLVRRMGDPSLHCEKSRGIPNSARRVDPATPVIPGAGGRLEKYTPPKGESADILASVGINKDLRAAERGMLFNYEVMMPGQRFRTVVVDGTGSGEFTAYLREEGLLHLGRGASRGLGRAEARVLRTWELGELVEDLKGRLEGWVYQHPDGRVRVALYARSPATWVGWLEPAWRGSWGYSSPLPRLDPSWIGREVTVSPAIGRDGRVLAIGGRTKFLSVSYPTGLPRPTLSCSERGSVFVFESKGGVEEVSEAVALGSVLGWDRLAVLGLNVLQPLGWWYDDPIYS